MTHVHFDLAEVERKFRAMHARMTEARDRLSNPYSREVEAAAAEAFEGTLTLVMMTPRLRNEGRDDAFIAHVYGSILANVMLNAVMASGDPGGTVEIIGRRIDRMLAMVGSGEKPGGSLIGHDVVVGSTGGLQ